MLFLLVVVPTLAVGFLVGYVVCYYTADVPAWQEEQRQREIERRLTGKYSPKHRSTAEPAVISSARIVGSKAWRP